MMELNVVLDFACGGCGHSLSVTLKCAGKGLVAGTHTVAAVKVPCPTCGSISEVFFQPNGTIHSVAPCRGARPLPEPSLN
jgi:hypothetical protein